MKINLNDIDRSCYHVNPHFVAGEPVYLVVPKDIGVKWKARGEIYAYGDNNTLNFQLYTEVPA